MTAQEQKQTQVAWDSIASGYDDIITSLNMSLAEKALEMIDLRPGMRLLDVASGSGAISIPAARQGADVLAADISPVMIERLDARARDEGLENLQARVMDCHNLDLDDESFDVAASQFGVMLFPDLPRGLSEMARVTKRGGHVLVVTFGPPHELEFLQYFAGAIKAVNPEFQGLPTDPPPLPFQVSDPAKLQEEMTRAGLRDVRIERANHRIEPESGSHFWEGIKSSNPIGAALAAELTEEQQVKAQAVLDDMLRQRAEDGVLVANNAINIAIGIK